MKRSLIANLITFSLMIVFGAGCYFGYDQSREKKGDDTMSNGTKGYLIANYTILDPPKYQLYAQAAVPLIIKYGGKMLVGDLSSKILEGNPAQFIAVVEFENLNAAERFYTSPEYTKIKPLRTSSTEGFVMISKEFVMPEK
jgi:uncharacterized protein (DUF1330 family)